MHKQHIGTMHVEQRRNAAQRRLVQSLIHRDDNAHLSLLSNQQSVVSRQ